MHIIESYATHCGLRIDKPWIYETYYPIVSDKYITLQPSGGADVRDYDYWHEVINYIYPYLKSSGIKIVQLGNEKDALLPNCIHTQGQTTLSQFAYIIKNSTLHLGVDSLGIHVASSYGKKIVGLYCNQWTRSSGPYWSKEGDVVLHQPNRDKVKPSFSLTENPKTINEINAEKVAQSVLDLLGIDSKIPFERVFVGKNYAEELIQNVPTSVAQLKSVNGPIVIRMDIEHDEEILENQFQLANKVVICTNKPINTNILIKNKNKIQNIVYYIDHDNQVEFVKTLKESAVPFSLMTRLQPEEYEKYKLDYFDYGFIFRKTETTEDAEKIKQLDISKLLFKTNKKILKDGKCYNSLATLEADSPQPDPSASSFQKVIDSPSFWEFLDETYIVKKLD